MPPKRTPVKKTAPVAVALPVADEEPEEVASVYLCPECKGETDIIGEVCEKCRTPPVVADDEPSEDDEEEVVEEDTPLIKMLKGEKGRLIKQKEDNLTREISIIHNQAEENREKIDKLREEVRLLLEENEKLISSAHHKAREKNRAIDAELNKVLTFLGEAKAKKNAERKASGEIVKAKSSTFFSRKPLNEMVNRNTRFIYEQKKGCVFKRFCLIDKSKNCVYECDEYDIIKGEAFRSLNDFCVSVKKSVNYQGSLKQDTSVVLKYYDIASKEYKSFKDLTAPLN